MSSIFSRNRRGGLANGAPGRRRAAFCPKPSPLRARKRAAWAMGCALAFVAGCFAGCVSGCASGHCRSTATEAPGPVDAATAAGGGSVAGAAKNAPKDATKAASETTVLVYKADGSLQCGMGKGASAEEMEKELAGISVASRDKRADGMMHIQACGQATGMANVYEIPLKSLPTAEKRGFRRLRPG